ncbi:MAG: hypothetical protein AAF830_16900 [Pseudomonadota bacterium]
MTKVLAVLLIIGAVGHLEAPLRATVVLAGQGMSFIADTAAP